MGPRLVVAVRYDAIALFYAYIHVEISGVYATEKAIAETDFKPAVVSVPLGERSPVFLILEVESWDADHHARQKYDAQETGKTSIHLYGGKRKEEKM